MVHNSMLHSTESVEQLTMDLYKKAVDDIAFQAGILGFLLREIPLGAQQRSCEFVLHLLQHQLADAPLERAG